MNASESLVHALLNSFNHYKQQLHGKRVWLACSGGRDSLSLAIICRDLFEKGQLPFLPQLLHVNHGIQEANAAWSQQVLTWAKQHDMPCRVLTLNLDDKSEQSARHARYEAMMAVMNCEDVLMLGHHQDDQVETVLMRLFNGAGVTGLGGMEAWRFKQSQQLPSSIIQGVEVEPQSFKAGIYLWRPWLSVSRAQITAYAKSINLDYIDDPTNILIEDTQVQSTLKHSVNSHIDDAKAKNYKNNNDKASNHKANNDRAWLRSELMPRLLERYPKAQSSIARSSQLISDASHIINEQIQADLTDILLMDDIWHSVIDINKLTTLSAPRQSALIHAWLTPSRSELPPSKRLVDDVLDLSARADNNHQTSLYWDTGLHEYEIRRYQDELYRMQVTWLNWLKSTPTSQHIELSVENVATLPESLSLKPEQPDFIWYLMGLDKLVSLVNVGNKVQENNLNNPINNSIENLKSNTANHTLNEFDQLILEPLARELKVTLATNTISGRSGGVREGRKSGKKLLQAIHQPSFMRQSVMLCSLFNTTTQTLMPLFIITVKNIIAVDSPFLEDINELIANKVIESKVGTLPNNSLNS